MVKRPAALILLAALFLSLCACGGYVCVWQCAYMDTGDSTLTAADLTAAGTNLSLDLRRRGIGYMSADGETQKIGWSLSEDGTILYLTVDGELESFAVDHGALVWDMSGVSVTFYPETSEEYQHALNGE